MGDGFESMNEPLPRRLTAGLAKLGLVLRSQAWQQAQDTGLTPTQGQILALLRARGPLRLGMVSRELAITPATASDAAAALVRKGLARKDRAPDDRRALALTLTKAGEAAALQSAEWPDALLGAVDALDPEEQAALLKMLMKMIRALQLRGAIAPARMCATCLYFRPNAYPDSDTPHHCAFVDAPFGTRDLRLDCGEQEPAAVEQAAANWRELAETTTAAGRASGSPSPPGTIE